MIRTIISLAAVGAASWYASRRYEEGKGVVREIEQRYRAMMPAKVPRPPSPLLRRSTRSTAGIDLALANLEGL